MQVKPTKTEHIEGPKFSTDIILMAKDYFQSSQISGNGAYRVIQYPNKALKTAGFNIGLLSLSLQFINASQINTT